MNLLEKARTQIKSLAEWENSPTKMEAPYVRSSAVTLGKFVTKTAANALSSLPVVSVATAIPFVSATVAFSFPQVRLATSLVAAASATGAAALWFFRKSHTASVDATLEKQKQEAEKKLQATLVNSFGGESAIGASRGKPSELSSGMLEFKAENFPADKAVVKAETGKKATQYGLRLVNKTTKEPLYITVGYAGGKLKIETPSNPALVLSPTALDKITDGSHATYELVAPQGKELTLLQDRLSKLETSAKEGAREIAALKRANKELEGKVEGLTKTIATLVTAQEAIQKKLAAIPPAATTTR